jgi:hypothetical protein
MMPSTKPLNPPSTRNSSPKFRGEPQRRLVLEPVQRGTGVDPGRQLPPIQEGLVDREHLGRGVVVDGGDAVAAEVGQRHARLLEPELEDSGRDAGLQAPGGLGERRPVGARPRTPPRSRSSPLPPASRARALARKASPVPAVHEHRVLRRDRVDHARSGEKGSEAPRIGLARRSPWPTPRRRPSFPPVIQAPEGIAAPPLRCAAEGPLRRPRRAGWRRGGGPGLVEMGVVVDEAGRDEATLQLHHPGVGPLVPGHLGARPHGHDPVPPDGEGFGHRLPRRAPLHAGPELATGEDQVRRALPSAPPGPPPAPWHPTIGRRRTTERRRSRRKRAIRRPGSEAAKDDMVRTPRVRQTRGSCSSRSPPRRARHDHGGGPLERSVCPWGGRRGGPPWRP